MLQPPDGYPIYIQLFDLEYKHISAKLHKAPDGLSRRLHATEDSDNTDPEEDCDQYGPFIRNRKLDNSIKPPLEAAILPTHTDVAYISSIVMPVTQDNDESSEERLENSDPFKQIPPEYSEYPDLLEKHYQLSPNASGTKGIQNRKSFIQTVWKYFIYDGALWR